MAYTYSIMDYSGVEEDFRAIFGIDETVVSNSIIHSLPILPAAEMEVRETIELVTLDDIDREMAILGILYKAAANAYNVIKVNILQKETDNRTAGERFSNALNFSKEELNQKADYYLSKVKENISSLTSNTILEFVSPAIDEVTGS